MIALVFIIDALVVTSLIAVVIMRGFERSLPLVAFYLVLFPYASKFNLPGLFDITTQRLLVILLIPLYFLFGRTQRGGGRESKLPLRSMILLQLLWMIIATVNSVVFSTSLKLILSQMFDFYLTYYFFSKAISKLETVHKVLFAITGAMSICSVFGAIEAYKGWTVLGLFPQVANRFGEAGVGVSADRGIRVMATFGHPILFGSALALAIPMALYLLTVTQTKKGKIALWVAMMLMFLDIFKTSSRGPWIALAISFCLLFLFSRGKVRRPMAAVLILVITVLIARPGIWQTIRDMYGATRDPESLQGESYQWRYALYDMAYRELARSAGRAAWGYGPESFYYLGLEGEFQGKVVKFESCDSSIAAIMIETGYIGLLITSLLLIRPAIFAFTNGRRIVEPVSSDLCLLFFVNMCAFYFLMTNVAIFGWGQQTYIYWIIVALAMKCPALIIGQAAQTVDEPKCMRESIANRKQRFAYL